MFNRIGALFGGSAGRAEADPRLETFADARLQTDVTVMLGVADRAAADLQSGTDDPCRDRTIRRVEVLEAPTFPLSGGWVGPWTEAWTMDRCGTSFCYVVEFTAADDGGTDYRLRDPIERPDTGVAPT